MAVAQGMVMDVQTEALREPLEVYRDRIRPDAAAIGSGADQRIGCLSNADTE